MGRVECSYHGNIRQGVFPEFLRDARGELMLEPAAVPSHRPQIVYIVESDGSVRRVLEDLVCDAGWQLSVFASAEAFLSDACPSCPGCLVLELVHPGISGLDLQRRIVQERPDIPIIFISECDSIEIVVRAMRAGATEFISKPFEREQVLNAIELALRRSRAAQEVTRELRILRDRYANLSERERQVMRLVITGLMNKQVAHELGITEVTVKAHRGRVTRKMGARSLAELVVMAVRLGIPRYANR